MTENVDRSALAAILERLGSVDDADVLSAAREAHAVVAAAGVSWTELMVTHQTRASEDAEWDEDQVVDGPGEDDSNDEQDGTGDDMTEQTDRADAAGITASPSSGSRSNADILRLLDRLLAQEKSDPEFCAELEGYKQDIANGEFDDRDRNYVRDLYDRLRKAPTPA